MAVIEQGGAMGRRDDQGAVWLMPRCLLLSLALVLTACGITAVDMSPTAIPTTTTTMAVSGPVTTGRVLDGTGMPLVGAGVKRWVVGETWQDFSTTDADGRFEFAAAEMYPPSGEWRVTAYPPPERSELLPKEVSLGTLAGGLVPDVEVVLSVPSTLTVEVSAGGQPADAWVYLVRGDEAIGAAIDGPTVGGAATFDALPLGEYRVFVDSRTAGFADEWLPSTLYRSRATTLPVTGGDQTVDIELEAAAKVTGRLFLPDGTPAADAPARVGAYLDDAQPNDAAVFCQEDVTGEPVGTFRIACLHPAADYVVSAQWESPAGTWFDASATVQVSAGQTTIADLYLGDGPAVVPVVPARLVDSRAGGVTVDGVLAGGGPVVGGSVLAVPVVGRHGVPGSARAVVLNVTAVRPDGVGFLTVFPCGGGRPTASNVNFVAGEVVANSVTVKLGADGDVCVFSPVTTNVVVDLNAYAT